MLTTADTEDEELLADASLCCFLTDTRSTITLVISSSQEMTAFRAACNDSESAVRWCALRETGITGCASVLSRTERAANGSYNASMLVMRYEAYAQESYETCRHETGKRQTRHFAFTLGTALSKLNERTK